MTTMQRGAAAPRALWNGKLTPAQAEVLELVAEGLSTPEIAQRIGRAEQTVKYHLKDVFDRLAVRNRVEAARWWWENVELAETRSYWMEALDAAGRRS